MDKKTEAWTTRVGRWGAVLLALSMLIFYVLWSQKRVQPVIEAVREQGKRSEQTTLFSSSKSLSGVIPESAVTDGLLFGDDEGEFSERVDFDGVIRNDALTPRVEEAWEGGATTMMPGSKNLAQSVFSPLKEKLEGKKTKDGKGGDIFLLPDYEFRYMIDPAALIPDEPHSSTRLFKSIQAPER